MNGRLEYLADSLIIEALAKDDLIAIAQEGGLVQSVAQGVKDYVSSQFDKNKPIASVVSFMGPGLLWSMNFKWMSVLYTLAEALGFDWRSFWSAVGRGIAMFVKTIIGSDEQVPEDEVSNTVNSTVQNAFMKSFTGEADMSKLLDLAKHKFANNMSEALEIKAMALRLEKNPKIVKEASIKSKLSSFFIRTISWLVKTALISLGFISAAGAGKALVDHESPTESAEQAPSLKVAPNAPAWMFSAHSNDMSNVWIERGDINEIQNILKSWILAVYPQLNTRINDIENSSSFQNMVNKFKTRNRLAGGLGLISIPRPYQRKSDIVTEIVNQYLKESPQEPQQESAQPETRYL